MLGNCHGNQGLLMVRGGLPAESVSD
jgi:hypothetical protein